MQYEEIVYAVRSKKSGGFFSFEQYYDDGYGEYHDNTSKWHKATLWSERDYKAIKTGELTIYDFAWHKPNEIEWVKIYARMEE